MSHQRVRKRSSNDQPHPYMRGYDWWVNNQYWERDGYTEKGKEIGRAFLAQLHEEELSRQTFPHFAKFPNQRKAA
jgi:hypothetical protein